ncbi:hypothetical protein GE09DRAFT_728193 [Coniochaeta sp. 2T2.1]|nr:hypothetical protein GE09DRAFT_728193 [Coniochaeta sp. 2T2.1]
MQLTTSSLRLLAVALLSAAIPVLAKTDLSGCVSTEVIFQQYYASLIWYVPDTGEICSFVDCGGGRAPPKTTQPGCAGYTGTETVTPSYLSCFGAIKGSATTVGGGDSAAPTTAAGSEGETSTMGNSPSTDTDAGDASPTAGAATITRAPTVDVSGGTVVVTNTNSEGQVTSTDTGGGATGGAGGAGGSGSSSSSSSSSTSRVSTAAAAGQTGVSKSMLGVVAGMFGGLALL